MFSSDLARPGIPDTASLSVVLWSLAIAGCGGAGEASSGFEVRDSAGVTVVENTSPRWAEEAGWHLSDSPSLDIGVLEGAPEDQLYQVRGAVRLGDGRIAIANGGSHELRFYSPDGEHIESIGREGEGPGEFKSMGSLMSFGGDSLVIWDWNNRRASVFDTAGDFARSFRFEPPRDESAWPYPIAPLADGTLLVDAGRVFMSGEVQSGVSRDSTLYLLYDRDGVLIDSIGRFPGAERFIASSENFMSVTSLAFGRTPAIVPSGQGFYYGSGDSYEIGYYGIDGSLRRLTRKAQPILAVTQADIDLYKEQQLESTTNEGWRQRYERMLADMPYHETMPAISGLEVDAAGNLWVNEYRRPGDEEPRWSVFDGEGRLLGEVRMPARFSVFEIGPDYVLGRWTDDFDVEHVRVYELIKG